MISEKDADKVAKDIAENMFDSWLVDLEEKDQPDSCSIESEDCENCGS
jgi:uncharacterized UPF0146 family protein